jgi:hypothetical protein
MISTVNQPTQTHPKVIIKCIITKKKLLLNFNFFLFLGHHTSNITKRIV